MKDLLSFFTFYELNLIQSALGETVAVLRNRFEYQEGYVHPAEKYEQLYDKLENLMENF
jgi:hypothetical protein